MSLFFYILWLVFGALFATYIFFKKKYAYWKDRNINYLEPVFPMGNVIYGQNYKGLCERLYKHRDASQIIGGYVGWKPILMITNLDLIQRIYITDFNNFIDRGFYYNEKDDPLSAHIAALDGEPWRFIRTKLTPSFTVSKLKFMFPTMLEVSHCLHSTLAEMVKQDPDIEIMDFLTRFAIDVIGSSVFGIECNSLKEPNCPFQYYGHKVFDDPHLSPALFIFATHFPTLARRLHITFHSKDVRDFFMAYVRDTIEYREKNNVRRNDFLDLLLQQKKEDNANSKMTDNQMAAQMFAFFIAGYETTRTAMAYAFYELAKNLDIQEKVRREIRETLAKHNNEPTYEALNELEYMDRVITESLRIHPVITFNTRHAMRDYRIPNSNIVIEKGTGIFIPVYEIHHDPEIYENPEVFDPERFRPENIAKRHPKSFLGFGDGPRNCLGARFARMEMRIALVSLLQRFRIEVSAKCRDIYDLNNGSIVMMPKYGIVLKFEQI